MRLVRIKVTDSLMVAASILLFTNLLITTVFASPDGLIGTTYALSKEVHNDHRARAAAPQYEFSFMAQNVCKEDVKGIETCVTIWGSGNFNTDFDQITAWGNFAKYVDNVPLTKGTWSAVELSSGSDKDVSFKSSTSNGVVNIVIDKGDRKHQAEVCLYGELIATGEASDMSCVNTVKVTVEALR